MPTDLPTRAVSILHLLEVVCPATWSGSAGSPATAAIECPLHEGFPTFSTGVSWFTKDIGRRSAVPRMQRVCQKCTLNEIGDEKHLIFACPAVHHVRDRYAGLFSESVHTMLDFMWQDDLVEVAKFVMDCFDVMSAAVEDDRTSNQP